MNRYAIKNLGQLPPGAGSYTAEGICRILQAMSEATDPAEQALYTSTFAQWYGQVASSPDIEAATVSWIGRLCPDLVKLFNALRADYLRREMEQARSWKPIKPPPPPPPGPSVPTGDPNSYPPVRPSKTSAMIPGGYQPTPIATQSSQQTWSQVPVWNQSFQSQQTQPSEPAPVATGGYKPGRGRGGGDGYGGIVDIFGGSAAIANFGGFAPAGGGGFSMVGSFQGLAGRRVQVIGL